MCLLHNRKVRSRDFQLCLDRNHIGGINKRLEEQFCNWYVFSYRLLPSYDRHLPIVRQLQKVKRKTSKEIWWREMTKHKIGKEKKKKKTRKKQILLFPLTKREKNKLLRWKKTICSGEK